MDIDILGDTVEAKRARKSFFDTLPQGYIITDPVVSERIVEMIIGRCR